MPSSLAPVAGRRLLGVRVRLTLAATVVTGLALLGAGVWLVQAVERSLTDELEEAAQDRLDAVRMALETGATPNQAVLRKVTPDGFVQVISGDGRVAAASPGIEGIILRQAPDGTFYQVVTDEVPDGYGGNVAITSERALSPFGMVDLVAATSLDPVRRGVDAVRDGLVLAFPLLVGTVALLAWFTSGRALRPVELIRTEVEAITGSTLDRRVPVPHTRDEVARLANTMNAMLDRLEDASTRQQRFVADASHELRSPVAAIRTELEVAQRTARAEDWPRVAERLLTEEARLEAVITDLLLLASLDEGAGSDNVIVDLAELAHEEARRRAPDRDAVRVEVDAATPVLVQGSRMQLRRVLANLIDNAGRHARTTVRVGVIERDGRARILVDDDGAGIDEADRERVFERFTRLDDHRARVRATGGAGLGLSLVRRIAERHHGTALVDTAPLGGARVVIDLPVHVA